MYVYCVYPAMSKFQDNCQLSEKADAIVVLIVFNCVFYDVSAYNVACSSTSIREQSNWSLFDPFIKYSKSQNDRIKMISDCCFMIY